MLAVKATEVLNHQQCKVDIYSEVLLIQCKNLKIEKPLSQIERSNLKKLAKKTGGKAIHVYNSSRHKLVFEELN